MVMVMTMTPWPPQMARGSGSVGVFSLTGRPHNAGHRVISYCPLGFLLVLPDILTLSINQPLSLVIGRNKLCD